MIRPVNPSHIYPVYDRDNDFSLQGWYSAPTYRTQSLQFKRTGTDTVAAFDLVLRDGTVLSQDAGQVSTFTESGGATFYWTGGASLINPPSPGSLYRPRITLSGGSIYWGHQIRPDAIFDFTYPTLRIDNCVLSGGGQDITIGVTYPTGANVQVILSDDNSSYSATFPPGSAIFNTADLTPSGGNYSATITVYSYYFSQQGGSRQVGNQYTFTASQADVCGTAVLGSPTNLGGEDTNTFELTIDHSNDIQSEGIRYNSYSQKLWFVGYYAQPVPLVSPNFLENGQGEQIFQSSLNGEQQVVEFWPCPGRAKLGLTYAGQVVDNITLTTATNSFTLDSFEFEQIQIDQEDRLGGRLLFNFSPAFVQNIMEDYVS